MTLRKIRGLLYEHGVSLKEVALRSGRSHATVRVVMSGHGKSRPIQEAVAKILRLPYEQVWNTNSRRKAA